jgi:hypothetical protein
MLVFWFNCVLAMFHSTNTYIVSAVLIPLSVPLVKEDQKLFFTFWSLAQLMNLPTGTFTTLSSAIHAQLKSS